MLAGAVEWGGDRRGMDTRSRSRWDEPLNHWSDCLVAVDTLCSTDGASPVAFGS
jgi:hypothetical protein